MRLTLCKASAREMRPDHNTGNSVPYSLTGVCRVILTINTLTNVESIALRLTWVLSKLTVALLRWLPIVS